jgi:ribose transport system substrate-binding protein
MSMKISASRRWPFLAALLLLTIAVLAAGCGGSGDSSSGSTRTVSENGELPGEVASNGEVTPPKIYPKPPQEATKAIDKFVGEPLRPYYEGYWNYAKLKANPYAGWTPPQGSLHYCLSAAFLGNNFTQSVAKKLEENVSTLQSEGKATGPLTVTNSNFNIPLQAANINQLVGQGCNVIWVIDVAPTGLCDAMAHAHEENVLVATIVTPVYCKDAINVDISETEMGALPATDLVHALNGEGNVLIVTGLPGLPVSEERANAAKAVFEQAPGMDVVGEIRGDYTPSVAKTNVLKFLATHPEPIDAVIEGGSMGIGIAQAFDQAGRPRPLLGEVGATCAYLAYWKEHELEHGYAMVFGGLGAGEELYQITKRMLDGEELKGNLVLYPPIQLTSNDFDEWYKPAYTLSSTCQADKPGDNKPYPDSFFDPLFQ